MTGAPLQLVLMGVGDQQLPEGPGSAGPAGAVAPCSASAPGQELAGSISHMEVRRGADEELVTRIRVTGEKARSLWEALCRAAGQHPGSAAVQHPGSAAGPGPGAPRSSTA